MPEEVDAQNSSANDFRLKLHGDHCKLAWDAIRSSSDEYDKNLLKLSTAFLGLSLTFMKDVVGTNRITHCYSLYASWASLAAVVLAVVVSFQLSIRANTKHLKALDDYYLQDVQEALNRRNGWSIAVEWTNVFAGLFFVAGLVLSVYFVIANFGGK